MRQWLWISVALATGCFSEPVDPAGSGGTDADDGTGPTTTEPVVSSSSGESSTTGIDPTDPTDGTDESSETTDPSDSSSSTTSSEPACGNGVVEGDESCDGTDLDGMTCVELGFEVGNVTCTRTCTLDDSGCGIAPATRFGEGMSWAVPEGGSDGAGFHTLTEFDLDRGDQSWATVDLDGDGMLDLSLIHI